MLLNNSLFEWIQTQVETTNWVWVIVKNSKNEIITVIENNPENKEWKKKWQKWIIFWRIEWSDNSTETAIRETYEEIWIKLTNKDLTEKWSIEFYYGDWWNKVKKIKLDIFEAVAAVSEGFSIEWNDEIVWIKIIKISDLIKEWEQNKSSIRPITFEAIFANEFWWYHRFVYHKLLNWEYIWNMWQLEYIINKLNQQRN